METITIARSKVHLASTVTFNFYRLSGQGCGSDATPASAICRVIAN